MKPRNIKNASNCIFCNEETGECMFNVNWPCSIRCLHHISFNPNTQIQTKRLFDMTMGYLRERNIKE
jgi:hypothetical protein